MNDFEDTVIDKIVGLVKQDSGARPITDDMPALVRMLTAATAMTLSHDSAFVGRGNDPQPGRRGGRAAVAQRAVGRERRMPGT